MTEAGLFAVWLAALFISFAVCGWLHRRAKKNAQNRRFNAFNKKTRESLTFSEQENLIAFVANGICGELISVYKAKFKWRVASNHCEFYAFAHDQAGGDVMLSVMVELDFAQVDPWPSEIPVLQTAINASFATMFAINKGEKPNVTPLREL